MNKLYELLLGGGVNNYGETRDLYPSEDAYFNQNKNVAGMATEDNKVILNPYSSNTPEQQDAVRKNEGVRLYLRQNPNAVSNFSLTPYQQQTFANYSPNIQDQRSTILARILTGDTSAGNPTLRQILNARKIRKAINNE